MPTSPVLSTVLVELTCAYAGVANNAGTINAAITNNETQTIPFADLKPSPPLVL
jgi:hypothetical protein